MKRFLTITASAVALTATGASAATSAFATTDLNLRAGPGPQYEILDVISGQDTASVEGCVEAGGWCKVSYDGTTGWAYSEYLTASLDQALPVYGEMSAEPVPTVTYEHEVTTTTTVDKQDPEAAMVGSTAGALLGSAIIGGPAGIAGGMILGTIAGAQPAPEEVTVTYVHEHPVEPVYLQGEVVTGARLPAEVQLVDIPDSEYQYLAVNNNTVLVDPETREIVYILR